jgi:hypothetical protein
MRGLEGISLSPEYIQRIAVSRLRTMAHVLNVNSPAFIAGWADAIRGGYAPDRFKKPQPQVEYEMGWAFARWCNRHGLRLHATSDIQSTFTAFCLDYAC